MIGGLTKGISGRKAAEGAKETYPTNNSSDKKIFRYDLAQAFTASQQHRPELLLYFLSPP